MGRTHRDGDERLGRWRAGLWLNLRAHPDASVVLVDGSRLVRARVAKGDERSRLWGRWREIDAKLDACAALRSSETAVVILESRPEPGRW